MQRLEINLVFNVERRAQAKFLIKQIDKIRKQAMRLGLCDSSRTQSFLTKLND